MSTVTLYSTPWCGYCRVTKRFLDEQQVPYIEIDANGTVREKAEFVEHDRIPNVGLGG